MKRLISVLFLALAATSSCNREEEPDMSIPAAFIGEAPDHPSIVRYAMDFDYPEWIQDIILEIKNSPDEKLVHFDIFGGWWNSETVHGQTVYFIIYRDKPDKGTAYWEDGRIIDLSDPVRLTDFTENTIMWQRIFDIERYIDLTFLRDVMYQPQSNNPDWLQRMKDETDSPDFPYNSLSIYKGEWKRQTVYIVRYGSECRLCNIFNTAGNKINFGNDEELLTFCTFSKNWIRIFQFTVLYENMLFYEFAPYEPVDSLPEWILPMIDKTPYYPEVLIRVLQGEWRERTVYLVILPGKVFDWVFYENGEQIVWESKGEMRLTIFLRDSKNWKKIYDSTLQDEIPAPITDD